MARDNGRRGAYLYTDETQGEVSTIIHSSTETTSRQKQEETERPSRLLLIPFNYNPSWLP